MHAAVTEEGIQRANAQFWEQMLAMHLAPVESAGGAALCRRCIGIEHVVGSCVLSGAWNGCIEVRLSRGLALEATSAMLMQPVDELQDGDLLDSAKEIAKYDRRHVEVGAAAPLRDVDSQRGHRARRLLFLAA
jgi:hypothetical protein